MSGSAGAAAGGSAGAAAGGSAGDGSSSAGSNRGAHRGALDRSLPTARRGILYGGDWNPEQWGPEVWDEDIALMRRAQVNLVTVGVFSWALLEPAPGVHSWAWLDDVLDRLARAGIAADLATATASPPAWLSRAHPEMLPVTREGATLWPGARQHYCPSSPVYREAALTLVEALARRYGDHPALEMWHVGNEYGCHVAACYCDVSAARFRAWLADRYGDVAALNQAWGTAFWSQAYHSFDEILPPRLAPTLSNPTQVLDFARFSSDELLGCYLAERQVLESLTPTVPVTTNFMGLFRPVDYWRFAPHVDIVADDSYPDPADPLAYVRAAMVGDLMRSLGDGAPWMLMEQAPSAVNWRPRNARKPPGMMRSLSLQAVGRGADGICFFQWRAARAGAEKFHSAMVPHAGAASRTFEEVTALGEELGRLREVVGTSVDASVAILLDWSSWWALEQPSHPDSTLELRAILESWYEPLYRSHVPVDFVSPAGPLGRYRVLLAPNLYLVAAEHAKRLADFVATGGTLVVGPFSGIVDQDDHVPAGPYPAAFREVLGLEVEELAPLADGEVVALTGPLAGSAGSASGWQEVIHLRGAEVLARYATGPLAGMPAVTTRSWGTGQALYVGCGLDAPTLEAVLARAWQGAGVRPLAEAPGSVGVSRRGRFCFYVNTDAAPVEVELAGSPTLVTGGELEEAAGGRVVLRLPGHGAAVVDAGGGEQS